MTYTRVNQQLEDSLRLQTIINDLAHLIQSMVDKAVEAKMSDINDKAVEGRIDAKGLCQRWGIGMTTLYYW